MENNPISLEQLEELEEQYEDGRDYEKYEEWLKLDEDRNNWFIKLFEADLEAKDLKPKTITRHIQNVSFYLNEFLTREMHTMEEGLHELNEFFGWFYIRKCLWSTPANLKTTAASLKKFYECMAEHEFITSKEIKDFKDDIRENMDEWQEECRQWNDPEYDLNEFGELVKNGRSSWYW